jgi:uncharacterized protein YndB with AHSA1/START domain
MGSFHLEIAIDRACEEVFSFVADPTTMPLWYDAVEHVTNTSAGPVATGTRYQITRSLPGGKAHNDVEITEYVTNRRVTLESRHGPTPFRYGFTLTPTRQGTTVRLDGQISGAGLPGPAGHIDQLTTPLFKHGMQRNLCKLKQIIEASP